MEGKDGFEPLSMTKAKIAKSLFGLEFEEGIASGLLLPSFSQDILYVVFNFQIGLTTQGVVIKEVRGHICRIMPAGRAVS